MNPFSHKESKLSILILLILSMLCLQPALSLATVSMSLESNVKVTPLVSSTIVNEIEPNNVLSQATILHNSYFGFSQPGLIMQGAISGSTSDMDWYKITTIISGELLTSLDWKDPFTDQRLEHDLRSILKDADGNTLATSILRESNWYYYQSLSIQSLPAGTYYFGIETPSSDNKYVGAKYECTFSWLADCWVPNQPAPLGPTSGDALSEYIYSGTFIISDCNSPIEVRFDWGDGSQTEWSDSLESPHSWTEPGEYLVRVQNRCSVHPFIEGSWSNPLAVTMAAPDLELTTSSANISQGTVSAGGIYTMGTSVSATAFPASGYYFYRWTEADATVSRSNPYTFSIMQNRSLTACFRQDMNAGRLTGNNRYETAVSVSQEGWAKGAETVVLARGDNFADALAGVPLAYNRSAPILLTHPTVLPTATKNEIQRLGAANVIILGGTNAVSAAIEAELGTMGLSTSRIYGSSRYETAALIARELELTAGTFNRVHLATGANFPDALAAASYAAMNGEPILLTTLNALPSSTADALDDLTFSSIVIVGGTSAISAAQEAALDVNYDVTRISGSNRYTTAVELAKYYSTGIPEYLIATGGDFPDAITGAVLAANKETGILLVLGSSSTPPTAVQDYLVEQAVHTVTILGGTAAVSAAMENWF